jgi:hypothetical protein
MAACGHTRNINKQQQQTAKQQLDSTAQHRPQVHMMHKHAYMSGH